MIRNRTTPEGQELGSHMARFCDEAEPRARLKAPDILPRCASCAFREGPHLANGSPETQMTALKCVLEGEPFRCHDVHREGDICSGWLMLHLGGDGKTMTAPWDFVGGTDDLEDRAPTARDGGRESDGTG